jgi:hypothetical protein
MKLTGENRRTRGKTCPSSTLSTTNPTWTDPGSNPGLRGGRPAANSVSHGTARIRGLLRLLFKFYKQNGTTTPSQQPVTTPVPCCSELQEVLKAVFKEFMPYSTTQLSHHTNNAAGYRPTNAGSIPAEERSLYFSKASRLTLTPTQPPTGWLPWVLFAGVKSPR